MQSIVSKTKCVLRFPGLFHRNQNRRYFDFASKQTRTILEVDEDFGGGRVRSVGPDMREERNI